MLTWRFDYSVMINERANWCECEELSRKYRGMYEDVGRNREKRKKSSVAKVGKARYKVLAKGCSLRRE